MQAYVDQLWIRACIGTTLQISNFDYPYNYSLLHVQSYTYMHTAF